MKSANKDYNIILAKKNENGIYNHLEIHDGWMLLDAGWCAVHVFKILLDGNNLLFIQSLREGWLYYVASLYMRWHVVFISCMNFRIFQFLKSYLQNDYIMFLNERELCSLVGAKWALKCRQMLEWVCAFWREEYSSRRCLFIWKFWRGRLLLTLHTSFTKILVTCCSFQEDAMMRELG